MNNYNSFKTDGEKLFCIIYDGIAILSVKVASWLKFDGRYEITNTTDGISNGFFLTYNKK